MNNLAPTYLSDLVNLKTPSSRYNLRINDDKLLLDIPKKPHYVKMESAFTHLGPHTRDEPVVRNSGLFAGPERRTGGPVRSGLAAKLPDFLPD